MIGLLLWACQTSSTPTDLDQPAFTAAAVAATLPAGLESCDQIQAPALRSECVAFLVRDHGRAQPELAYTSCEELPSGVWRDECFFLLADTLIDARNPAQTAPICQQAGRYFQPCFMHLLKAHAGVLRAELPHGEAHSAYAAAISLAGTQAPKDFQHRAWSVFFRSAGGPDRVYDTRSCSDLSNRASDCISGVREALVRRLNRASIPPGLCQAKEGTVTALAPFLRSELGIAIAEDPALNAVLRPFFDRHCPTLAEF